MAVVGLAGLALTWDRIADGDMEGAKMAFEVAKTTSTESGSTTIEGREVLMDFVGGGALVSGSIYLVHQGAKKIGGLF